MTKSRKHALAVVLAMVFALVLTRALTLTHNMELHPDEHVFFTAAQSLKGYLSGSSPVYEEVKEYPEGAIVLQLPFHIFTAILNRLTGAAISPQLSGRIAAVFYFTAGAVLGYIVLYRYLSKKTAALLLYAVTMVYSIIHITQSRYGTADSVTLFLLMAVLLLSALSLDTQKHRVLYLFLSFFASGALCATKYPLLLFSILPVYCAFCHMSGRSVSRKLLFSLGLACSLLVGFALLSPKAVLDPLYVWRASTRELGAYMHNSGIHNFSWIWTHFASVFLYALLYSGFPLMPFFFVVAVKHLRAQQTAPSKVSFLFSSLLPLLLLLFFTYNLFVRLLVSRSFYPFFFLSDLYVAAIAGEWVTGKPVKRVIIVALSALMVVRGTYYLALLSESHDRDRLSGMIAAATNGNQTQTTILSGFLILPSDYANYPNLQVINSDDSRFQNPSEIMLRQGELFLAGARDFTVYSRYYNFLPSRYNDDLDSTTWLAFRAANAPYYVGSLYPTYLHYIFGNWLMGTNGCYEFPAVNVFYRP